VLSSVDIVEKDEFVLENDENQDPANVTQPYIPSIERIETLDCLVVRKLIKHWWCAQMRETVEKDARTSQECTSLILEQYPLVTFTELHKF
jgi:hypothetical protein